MFNFFKKKQQTAIPVLSVDVHSHLLPGIDDGVKTVDEAIEILGYMKSLGYRKVITTPHVISDIYRNTPATIAEALARVRQRLEETGVNIAIDAAAEYYLDESLMAAITSSEKLLTIGGRYLLFETNFLNEPLNLKEFVFLAASKGYIPVLAHPERYMYLHNDFDRISDLLNRGVLFQLNTTSLTGYYSKPAQQMAFRLIDRGLVHWLGSDCHHMAHARLLRDAAATKYFQKALTLPLLNNTIE